MSVQHAQCRLATSALADVRVTGTERMMMLYDVISYHSMSRRCLQVPVTAAMSFVHLLSRTLNGHHGV